MSSDLKAAYQAYLNAQREKKQAAQNLSMASDVLREAHDEVLKALGGGSRVQIIHVDGTFIVLRRQGGSFEAVEGVLA